nr:MAG TPA: hypothetical protein [Bacteriophage sp.]
MHHLYNRLSKQLLWLCRVVVRSKELLENLTN